MTIMTPALHGIRIYTTPLALAIMHRVERTRIKKRRKGYRVVQRQEPTGYWLNGELYMHPTMYVALKQRYQGVVS